jgi:hypothetical protein
MSTPRRRTVGHSRASRAMRAATAIFGEPFRLMPGRRTNLCRVGMHYARRETTRRNARKFAGQAMASASVSARARTERATKLGHLVRLKDDGALREPADPGSKRLLPQFQTAAMAGKMTQHNEQPFGFGRTGNGREDRFGRLCKHGGIIRRAISGGWLRLILNFAFILLGS